jgi:heptosyltransferase-2
MHILIIKQGALGDVVRTSYFAQSLREKHGSALRLSWLTAPSSLPLLRFNRTIDDLWTSFEECEPFLFDRVFSLDDELDAVTAVSRLKASRFTGAVLGTDGSRTYTADSATWFDMGIISKFGKERADALKAANQRGHAEIFSEIFEVPAVQPSFWGDPALEAWAEEWLPVESMNIGINVFAGGRWPSKQLAEPEFVDLVRGLLKMAAIAARPLRITLIGAGEDRAKNAAVAEKIGDPRVRVANTDDAILRAAALVGKLDYLISSDSLALHLGIAQRVPFLAFFSPTSAAEIDAFGLGVKVRSAAPDYCSYRANADNSTITAVRLLGAFEEHAARTLGPAPKSGQ